jgi:hypothetical protein
MIYDLVVGFSPIVDVTPFIKEQTLGGSSFIFLDRNEPKYFSNGI